MPETAKIKVILFDLGGVLVELDGPPLKAHWLKQEISVEENWRLWARSSLVEAFESGHISTREFTTGLIDEFQLNVSEEEFVREFTAWPKGLFPGTELWLKHLQQHYVLACYSNTSELHWPRLLGEMNLQSLLDHCFASFLLGCYKPALKGFELIVENLQVKAGEVLFLDDNAVNVEAAQAAGLQAKQVKSLAGAQRAISSLNLDIHLEIDG